MSRLRPVHKVVGETNTRRDWRARPGRKVRKFIVFLGISETLCPSRIRTARQVLFMSFLTERRTPIRKIVIFGSAGNCTIRILPGKLVTISTYISFTWCFLLLFLYTVFLSAVPVCNFQVI
jgi:hypothetical protein